MQTQSSQVIQSHEKSRIEEINRWMFNLMARSNGRAFCIKYIFILKLWNLGNFITFDCGIAVRSGCGFSWCKGSGWGKKNEKSVIRISWESHRVFNKEYSRFNPDSWSPPDERKRRFIPRLRSIHPATFLVKLYLSISVNSMTASKNKIC